MPLGENRAHDTVDDVELAECGPWGLRVGLRRYRTFGLWIQCIWNWFQPITCGGFRPRRGRTKSSLGVGSQIARRDDSHRGFIVWNRNWSLSSRCRPPFLPAQRRRQLGLLRRPRRIREAAEVDRGLRFGSLPVEQRPPAAPRDVVMRGSGQLNESMMTKRRCSAPLVVSARPVWAVHAESLFSAAVA